MGCNCSKNSRPTGFGSGSGTQKQDEMRAAAQLNQGASVPAASPNVQQSTQGATQQFTLTDRFGRVQSFARKLDAEAAKVRAGGGTIKPA